MYRYTKPSGASVAVIIEVRTVAMLSRKSEYGNLV
jgi:hypothetical protein